MGRYLSDEQRESVKTMKRDFPRMKYEEIAKLFHCSRTAVWKIINGYKNPPVRSDRPSRAAFHRKTEEEPKPKIIGPQPSRHISWVPSVAQLTARR
jgi:hypothetical protein